MTLREQFCADHPLEAELERIGVKLLGSGDKRTARCPFHDDKNPSFSVDLAEGSWNCFAGCGGGGVIELLAKHRGKSAEDIILEFKAGWSNGGIEKLAPPVDWPACVERFNDACVKRLCDWRGYSEQFVNQLVERRMVGMCDGNLSFPIFAGGKVIGTHQRLSNGSWVTRGGSGAPWVIGDHFENVIVFESQWDAFALMDALDWFGSNMGATCAVVITRGASKGKSIQNLFPTGGRIICWMQNDEPDAKGHIASDKWLSDVLSIVGRAFVCRPPVEHKDLNDWRKAGATGGQMIDLMEGAQSVRDPSLPDLRPPLDLSRAMRFNPDQDPNSLIGRRWLCRGGSTMWIGGSGIGKSVLTLQAAITFTLGESLFGLECHRPLKSVICSAEDDEGDIMETIQGVLIGMGIDEGTEKFRRVMENVLVFPETTLKGLAFVGWAEQLVREHKADLLWINPLLSYYSGNPSDPEKSAEFTGALSAMQVATGVCSMLVHHTGKPKDSKTTESWSIDDFSYIGLGSSVWTNWVRASVVLQARQKPKGVFVLRFAKRGNRANIIDESFEKVREVYVEHAPKGLRWVASTFCPTDDENETGGRPSKASWSLVYDAWDGVDKTPSEMRAFLREVLSISDKTASRIILKWAGIHIFKNASDLWTIKKG